MSKPNGVLVGAVAYDPKVVTIWEGLREYFSGCGVPVDFALFSNYERQVEALLGGRIDIAWNTPLAHVRVQKRTEGRSLSLVMRDSDRDFHCKLVVRSGAGIRTLADLPGKTLAVGSRDSTQARILPLHFLQAAGLDIAKVRLLTFDSDLGKHGDTGKSELHVLDSLREGKADAGVLGDLVWVGEQAAGRVDPGKIEVLWTSPPFDHCMFDALPTLPAGSAEAFRKALLGMRWDEPSHRRILEMEGLRQWLPPREEGYRSLREALDEQTGW
jgi:ABC-type phosphate/phosphonate transport system substrate-binding protein